MTWPTAGPNIVLGQLRHIRARVDMSGDDVQGLGMRLSSIQQHISNLHWIDVEQLCELGRLKRRVDRIVRRLEFGA